MRGCLRTMAAGLVTLAVGPLERAAAQPALPIPDPAMEPTATPPPSLFTPIQPGALRPSGTPPPFATLSSQPRPTAPTPAAPGIFSTTPAPTPSDSPAVVEPVPPRAPPRSTQTARPTATPVRLFVPSDTATPPPDAGGPQTEPPSVIETEDIIAIESETPTPRRFPAFEEPPELFTPRDTTTPLPEATPLAVATPRPTPQPARRPEPQTPRPDRAVAPSPNQIAAWVNQANASQDSALATRIGWAFYNREDFGSAGIWFSQAVDWNPKNGEAAYGLALTKCREGDLVSAEAITNFRGDSYPKMKALEGDIYSRRAFDYYQMRRYGQSLEYILKAAERRPLNRGEQMLLAWDYYHTRNYQAAADLFQKLYNAKRDDPSAEGLYASLSKLEDYDKLDRLATAGGPLKKVYATYEARQYYEAGLFRASADVGGDKIYPELVNLNGPSVALGAGYRMKSGQEGESLLNTGVFPLIQGQFSPAPKTMIGAYISRITLNAGDLAAGARVGTFPRRFTPYTRDPVTSYNNLWEFGIGFSYVDWWSFYANIGTSPQNGPVPAAPVGNAGIIYRTLQGYVQAEIFGRSVRDSLLSYVGMQDPYGSQNWGRVIETGGALSAFWGLPGSNTIFGKVLYSTLDGQNTEDNTRFAATAAFAREFKAKEFEFITLGPAVSYESYDNNQNFFTYGHGGYFSPQYLLQGIIQLQFLTREGRRWLAGGSLGAGWQTNEQQSAPFFPLQPDGRNYSSTSSSSGIGLINVTGGYLISPNWMVGGAAGYNVTADYNEGFINIWVRYFFEPRNGLIRDDLGVQGLGFFY